LAYLEISKKALLHNLEVIKEKIKDPYKVAVVLKDNAYGHGIDIVAPIAKSANIKHCVVRNIKEAVYVENLFETILILNPTKVKLKPHMYQCINDISQIDFIKEGSSVELKVDTGMHRNGIEVAHIDEALQKIEDKKLLLKGIFTHYRGSDILTSEFFWQKKKFEAIKAKYAHLNVRFHSFNSAALFRSKKCEDDLARVGIATYGYIDYEKGLDIPTLKPVMSLYAKKISTRILQKGERIGYGGEYEAPRDMVVSTYDAGYADGVFRINPDNPIPLANGKKVLGRISMDSLCAEGDDEKIMLFNDASIWAKHFNTISYEILVSMRDSLPRVQV